MKAVILQLLVVGTIALVSTSGFSAAQHRWNTIVNPRFDRKNPLFQATPFPQQPIIGRRTSGSLLIAGKMSVVLKKLIVGPKKIKQIAAALRKEATFHDVAFIAVLAWGLLPIARSLYFLLPPDERSFRETKVFQVLNLLSQLGKITALVYATDMLSVTFQTMGFSFVNKVMLSHCVAGVAYTVWIAAKLRALKTQALLRISSVKSPEDLGKNSLYNRLLDAAIFGGAGLFIVDLLAIETGKVIGSVFALGSVGTLVLSLASKDVASQFVSGMALSTSGRFYEGETINIEGVAQGKVVKMGWMYTNIRGGDEVVVRIPNIQIANQRVKNLSRVRLSQVKQELWVKYEDVDKIPALIADIKKEMIASCPKLLTEARPFRVHWRDYDSDHLTVTVDARFGLPPIGNAYWDNRQEALLAIGRAAAKNDVDFALPQLELKTGGDSFNFCS